MSLTHEIIAAVETWAEQMQVRRAEDPTMTDARLLHEQAALELGRRVAVLALSHQITRLGTGYDRSSRPCVCGARQRFERHRWRSLRTLAGQIRYRRAYYRCRACGASSVPLDEQIGQSRRDVSAGVERVLSLVSAHVSFGSAEQVLRELSGVELSARQIETVAESLGAEAEVRQQHEERRSARRSLATVAGPNHPEPRTWIVEMDGVQVGLHDGSWQETKCGIIYELSQRAELRPGRWELLERQRCALRGEVVALRRRLWALVLRAGVRVQDRIVGLGDGAEWIDQTADQLFPSAVRILDFYHAAERVWAVANARWGEGSSGAKAWASEKLSMLKAGRIAEVLPAMRRLKMGRSEAEAIRTHAVRYLSTRREQMRYDAYRAEGLPIGSGAIEASCKLVVTTRCKQAGMRWSESGVDAILALRCCVLNGRLDELRPKPQISIDWREAA